MHAPSLRTERLVAWPLSPDDIDEVAALWADRT
ncbi:MAG: GNAT family N-acetyltransferase, partial [Actinomyces sp.]